MPKKSTKGPRVQTPEKLLVKMPPPLVGIFKRVVVRKKVTMIIMVTHICTCVVDALKMEKNSPIPLKTAEMV